MKALRKDIAAFTIIIGVFSLVLIASALAEKAAGEHLPERNSRATAEATIASGLPGGLSSFYLLFQVSSLPTTDTEQNPIVYHPPCSPVVRPEILFLACNGRCDGSPDGFRYNPDAGLPGPGSHLFHGVIYRPAGQFCIQSPHGRKISPGGLGRILFL